MNQLWQRLVQAIPESWKARARDYISRASIAFARLSEREKTIVLGALAWVATMTVVLTTWSIISGIDGTKKRVDYNTDQLRQIIALRDIYRRGEERNAAQRSRLEHNEIRLSGLVEDEAKKLGIDTSNLNPHDGEVENGIKTQYVDLHAVKLSYDKVTTFMEHLESNASPVRVVKLKLNARYDEKDLVDMDLTVATYKAG